MKKLIAAALFAASMAFAPTGASAGLASSPASLNTDVGSVNVDQVRWRGGYRHGGFRGYRHYGYRHYGYAPRRHYWRYGYAPRPRYYGAYAFAPRFHRHRHFRHW
jgi:hypothetical protein